MPQFKEDKLIAEAYNNITEIASVYDTEEEPSELDKLRSAIFTVAIDITKGGVETLKTSDGRTFTLDRIFVMLDEAKTIDELVQIINTLKLNDIM